MKVKVHRQNYSTEPEKLTADKFIKTIESLKEEMARADREYTETVCKRAGLMPNDKAKQNGLI